MSKPQKRPPKVMGLDPGKVNFAFAMYGKKGLGPHGDLEGADEIHTIRYFRERFIRKLDRYRPSAVFVERYHLRQGKGAVINMELVNIMVGIVFDQCLERGIHCEMITASTHKAWTSRNYEVKKKQHKKR